MGGRPDGSVSLMAIVVRVKADELTDGVMALSLPTQGTVRGVVRLWYEQPSPPAAPGVPLSKSTKSIVIGDDIGPVSGPVESRYGESIQSGHVQRLGGWQQILSDRGLTVDNFSGLRNFKADIAVPAAMIDSYTG